MARAGDGSAPATGGASHDGTGDGGGGGGGSESEEEEEEEDGDAGDGAAEGDGGGGGGAAAVVDSFAVKSSTKEERKVCGVGGCTPAARRSALRH